MAHPTVVPVDLIKNQTVKLTIDFVLQAENQLDPDEINAPSKQLLLDLKRTSEKDVFMVNGLVFDWEALQHEKSIDCDDMDTLRLEAIKFFEKAGFTDHLPLLNRRYAQGSDAGIMAQAVNRTLQDPPIRAEFQNTIRKYVSNANGTISVDKTYSNLCFGEQRIPGIARTSTLMKDSGVDVQEIACSNTTLASFLTHDESYEPSAEEIHSALIQEIQLFVETFSAEVNCDLFIAKLFVSDEELEELLEDKGFMAWLDNAAKMSLSHNLNNNQNDNAIVLLNQLRQTMLVGIIEKYSLEISNFLSMTRENFFNRNLIQEKRQAIVGLSIAKSTLYCADDESRSPQQGYDSAIQKLQSLGAFPYSFPGKPQVLHI